ncbi:MAG: OB-fold nucleic acid binding domain-containing protein, partial [Vagococcus sp.]
MDKRTTYCGLVGLEELGQEITVKGWVQKRRDLGGLIFIDLRDREGIVQIVFNPETSEEALAIADKCRSEFVIGVKGTVVKREGAVNPNMKTGEIEIIASEIVIYNEAKTPPFVIGDENVNEDTRMKYRFMDIRRPEMFNNLKLRHETSMVI